MNDLPVIDARLPYRRRVARFVQELAKQLEQRTGVIVSEQLGTDRHARIVRVRYELWETTLAAFSLSLPETAAVFGVDHTTVLYALRKRMAERGEAPGETWCAKRQRNSRRARKARLSAPGGLASAIAAGLLEGFTQPLPARPASTSNRREACST